MFHVGQKVRKLSQAEHGIPPKPSRSTPPIEAGTILVIREIDARGLVFGHEAVTLRFQGVCGQIVDSCVGKWEVGYDARCFRPIVEHKTETGMAILREILDRESHHDKPKIKT